ncbi:unnamed protein product [Gordionus sp. m RMFG-2023]
MLKSNQMDIFQIILSLFVTTIRIGMCRKQWSMAYLNVRIAGHLPLGDIKLSELNLDLANQNKEKYLHLELYPIPNNVLSYNFTIEESVGNPIIYPDPSQKFKFYRVFYKYEPRGIIIQDKKDNTMTGPTIDTTDKIDVFCLATANARDTNEEDISYYITSSFRGDHDIAGRAYINGVCRQNLSCALIDPYEIEISGSNCTMLICQEPYRYNDVLLNFLPCNLSGNHLSSNLTGAICYMGVCRNASDLHPIDGSWNSWTSWSTCTDRTITSIRKRTCDNPKSTFGGRNCPGDRMQDKLCRDSISRAYAINGAKCTTRNNISTYDQIDSRPCVLSCYISSQFAIEELGNVASGTLVRKENSIDICILGTPVPIGCDDVLYSTAEWDNCGVCEGDNSSCVSSVEADTINFYNDIEIADLNLNTKSLYLRLEKEYNVGSTQPRSIIELVRDGTTYIGTQINELTDITYDVSRQREIVSSTSLIAPLMIKTGPTIDNTDKLDEFCEATANARDANEEDISYYITC